MRNRIQITNNDEDTTDACIKIEEDTRVSRSLFLGNMTWTTDSTIAYYIGGGIGGTQIEIWHEATGGNGVASTIYLPSTYEEPTAYGYQVDIRQTSGSPIKLTNKSKKRFYYNNWHTDSQHLGIAYVDFTGNIPPSELQIAAVGGEAMFGADVLYLFADAVGDTVVTDISGNNRKCKINVGASFVTTNTGWTALSFDGIDDFATIPSSESLQMNGIIGIVFGLIPKFSSTTGSVRRVFKWYQSDQNLVYFNIADGSGNMVFNVTGGGSTTTLTTEDTYSANDVVAVACLIDSSGGLLEVWCNGHKVGDCSYSEVVTKTSASLAIGAEWGGASLHTPFDMGFFAVSPYINRPMIKELTGRILSVMGDPADDYEEELIANTGDNVASASTIKLPVGNFFTITGTTQIDSINVNSPQQDGSVLFLKFEGSLQVTDGKNLKLGSNFTSAADTVLQLIRLDDNFYKVP